MPDTQPEEVGLQCLSDEALAGIVESELENDNKLSHIGEAAFDELHTRSPRH